MVNGVQEIVWHGQSLGTMQTAMPTLKTNSTFFQNFQAGDSKLGVDLPLLLEGSTQSMVLTCRPIAGDGSTCADTQA